VLRKPLPQPPPQQLWAAVVESPARKNAGGPWVRLCRGDAVVREVLRKANKERGMRDLMLDEDLVLGISHVISIAVDEKCCEYI
jgi:hypothetical protein